MKKLIVPLMLAALLPSCSGDGGEGSSSMADTTVARAKAEIALRAGSNDHHTKPNSYETTSVSTFPDDVLDHPFTYLMNRVIGRDDHRLMLYTVIPHAASVTYKLVNEKVNSTTWDLFFQAVAAEGNAKGLFVHTIYQIPRTVDGRDMTDLKVHIVDVAGNVLDDPAGAPPKKPKRPRHVRIGDKQDVDPNLPPEDPTIYVNGGMEDGAQGVCGFAYVYQLADALTLTDDVTNNNVEFTLSTTAGTLDFLYFDHNVDPFGTNAVKCIFVDTDSDSSTEPRWSICAP
ncbi:MAG: hypothetical protein IPL52_06780 [Flavobacteriales bacterium]|nr:hypothetical protein [Flavobacteriales bacterium]